MLTAAAGVPLAQQEPASRSTRGPALGDFVRVEGTRFVVGGRTFRFVGANASILHGALRRASAERALDAMAADGLRVVRLWALGEHVADGDDWARDYVFRMGPEGWVEGSFVHLDRVLAGARARGLRAIVVLANRWADYGGVPRYLAWTGALPPDHAAPLDDAMLLRFFTDVTVAGLYRDHVARVVGRVNTVTGIAYRDDPTVLAWELINESDAPRRGRDALVTWTREMARYVRSIDPNHLVAAGHIGYTRREQRDTWLALQRIPEIGYADAHAYPTSHGAVQSPSELDDMIDDHAQLAHHVLGKPLVWGEVGFSTRAATVLGRPRRWWFERFLARAERDGVAGVLAWTYCTGSDPPDEHGIFFEGARAAGTRDVRAVYARYAARWSTLPEGVALNPRLSPARGEEPLWNTRRRRPGPSPALVLPARGARWSVAPEHFAWIESEAAGRWDGHALTEVYARGPSRVAWTFWVTPDAAAAARRASRVRVRLRASSELPGRGEGATAEDGSDANIFLDGALVGTVALPVDDGLGAWVEVVSDGESARAVLRRVGRHRLWVEVSGENGFCLYGAPTGRQAVPPTAGRLPGRVEWAAE